MGDRRRQPVPPGELHEVVLERGVRRRILHEAPQPAGTRVLRVAVEHVGQVCGMQIRRAACAIDEPGKALPGQSGRVVEHGTSGAGHRNAELPCDVALGQRPAPMGLDAVPHPYRRRGHLERLVPVLGESPQARRGAVAQRRLLATREHRGVGPRHRRPLDVPDRIDAGIHRDRPACPDPILDRALPKAQRQKLDPGDVAVLPFGHTGYRSFNRVLHQRGVSDFPSIRGVFHHAT